MKPGRQYLNATLGQLHPSGIVALVARLGWPTWIGLLAALGGLAMLGATWHYSRQVRALTAQDSVAAVDAEGSPSATRQFARATEPTFIVPQDSTHLDDLKYLFKLAKAKGVSIDTVEYYQEPDAALRVLVRTMDIRVHEDYPKLKGFVAELLAAMPHAALQEIRVERKDARATQGQVLLKLALVYRAEPSPRPSPTGQGG